MLLVKENLFIRMAQFQLQALSSKVVKMEFTFEKRPRKWFLIQNPH